MDSDQFIWWWRGSARSDRLQQPVVNRVIDEFPSLAFLPGDVLHVLALPFVLLVTALALNLLADPVSMANRTGEATSNNLFDKLVGSVR
ncbi:MAG: hypothetical protein H6632_13005 [Anaerolineales bacterium]|nr:hypothetical protein [Anaerolineales bacterium]